MKIPCVFITGCSGVGKSTLLEACLHSQWPGSHRTFVPVKYSTRANRSAAEAVELKHIEQSDFRDKQKRGTYIIDYQNYGEQYGIHRTNFENLQPGAVYIQAVPTFVGLKLKEILYKSFDVRICLLQAGEATIFERLRNRSDDASLQHLQQRVLGARFDFSRFADVVIPTEAPREEVYQTFYHWVVNQFQLGRRKTAASTMRVAG